MNQDTHSFSTPKAQPIQVNLDEFNLSEDSFRPMTKGLGFHQEQKRSAFKPIAKEVKAPAANLGRKEIKPSAMLGSLSVQNTATIGQQLPSGLEAFYGTKGNAGTPNLSAHLENKIETETLKTEIKSNMKAASGSTQFLAWIIDVLVVLSFVAVTCALLVFASGIKFDMFARLITNQDLALFTASIFSIYYLLYFTILDLSASPGKTIMGIRLIKSDNTALGVKNTFTRALISLLSSIALFLPMLLDFQGRLSDTKVVK